MPIRKFLGNRWVKFTFWALLYVLWVVWLGNYWWLFGLPVIFDIYITRKVRWAFWKKRSKDGEKTGTLAEWVDSAIFAVVVVTFLNIFFIQSFKIPSSSMEGSLMTGDYLFVSKLPYGPAIPQTPLSIPFMHNVIPGTDKNSYSTLIRKDYRRLTGLGKVERDDYVVFNFPHGDTVLTKAPMDDYYTHVRVNGREHTIQTYGPLKVRPRDKKDFYVKRCVAVAGDSLSVVDGRVVVNGIPQKDYADAQYTYTVVTDGNPINVMILDRLGVSRSESYFNPALPGYNALPLRDSAVEKVRALKIVRSVEPNLDVFPPDYPDSYNTIFPFSQTGWTRDNFGPLWIPAKGATVTLTEDNLPFYSRIITSYEGNELVCNEDGIFINGARTDTYTFCQDYYFMMGDNRHNSLDSRYWGFVPEDHIVGRPAFIWFSSDSNKPFPSNIRWKRLCRLL